MSNKKLRPVHYIGGFLLFVFPAVVSALIVINLFSNSNPETQYIIFVVIGSLIYIGEIKAVKSLAFFKRWK